MVVDLLDSQGVLFRFTCTIDLICYMNFRSGADFVLCWDNKIEGVVPLQGMYFRNFFPNQGQGFKLSVTRLYPNIGLVPPPPAFLLNSLRLRIFGSVVSLHGYILFHFMQVKRRTTV